jgi:predicted ester cyclase
MHRREIIAGKFGNRVVCRGSRLFTAEMQQRDDAMTQDNKTIVATWFREFWGNPWNPRIINELATADILFHHPLHEPTKGRAPVTRFMADYREAFSDLSFQATGNLIAEGNTVVARWEGGGTHTGPAFSDFRMGSLPAASGRKMKFAGTSVFRLEQGRIAEECGQADAMTAMLQLGLIRIPEPETIKAMPGGSLPPGWNNMSNSAKAVG